MPITAHQAPAPAEPSSETIRILIVEDDALVATYIRDVLEESGFVVSGTASTGAEAFAVAATDKPRLALVDINLSGPLDGIEVARELRARHAVPAIFLSGIRDPDIEARANAIGSLGFLQKPFLPSQVFNALDRALKLSRSP